MPPPMILAERREIGMYAVALLRARLAQRETPS
jgi:hypothetical protein